MAGKAEMVPAELRVRSGDATVRLQLRRGPMFSLSSPQRRPPRAVPMPGKFPPAPAHRQRVHTDRALGQRRRTLIKSTFREWDRACNRGRLATLEREVQLLYREQEHELAQNTGGGVEPLAATPVKSAEEREASPLTLVYQHVY